MTDIRISNKPTLNRLLMNPENNQKIMISPEKVIFPKINTKLKKTHFTKYHSTFINAKDYSIRL